MTDGTSWIPDTLGADLAKLREKAGLSQKVLGERLGGVDASRLSRIEGGTVKLSAVELDKRLQTIGTDLATQYREYLLRDWKRLPKPPFWHPDRAVLGIADDTLARLETLSASLPSASPLLPQLDMYRQALVQAAAFLETARHDVVFIGETGVGKSFALSRLSRLRHGPSRHREAGREDGAGSRVRRNDALRDRDPERPQLWAHRLPSAEGRDGSPHRRVRERALRRRLR